MSTRFRISTPVAGFTGVVGNCAFGNGTYEGEVELGPLAYFRQAGYTVEDLDEEPPPPADFLANVEPLPAKSAAKTEWVAAAVIRGIALADAEKATKEQLFELLNTPNDPPAPEGQTA